MKLLPVHPLAKGRIAYACLTYILMLCAGLALPMNAGATQNVTCTFLNPDGPRAVACATVVTARITWTGSPPASILITVPNTFVNTDNLGATVLPGVAGSINYINLDSCALRRVIFNLSNWNSNVPLDLHFKYLGCTNINGCAANTQHLFFDCDYILASPTNDTLPATIATPGINQPGLTTISNTLAVATNSNTQALLLTNMSNMANSQNVYTSIGSTLDTLERQFRVTVNSFAVETVTVNLSLEPDASYSVLQIKDNQGNWHVLPAITGSNFTFNLPLSAYGNFITNNSNAGSRTLQLRQRYKLQCSSETANTQISCQFSPAISLCTCNTSGSTLLYNGTAGGLTSLGILNTTFQHTGEGSNSPCPGTFVYTINGRWEGYVGQLTHLRIPINTTFFNVSLVKIGNRSPQGNLSLSDSLTYTLAYTQPVDTNWIDVSLPGTSSTNIPGINWQYNSPGQGAWVNTSINKSFVVQITLQSNAAYANPGGCPSPMVGITPSVARPLKLAIKNICGNAYTQTTTPLPQIHSENPNNSMASINPIGLAADALAGNSDPVSFNYTISIPPNNDPFHMPGSAEDSIQTIHCSNIMYRGVFSCNPISLNQNSLDSIAVNGNLLPTSSYQYQNGQFLFPLNQTPSSSTTTLTFRLNQIPCPDPSSGQGVLNFLFKIVAECETCGEMDNHRVLECQQAQIVVHCSGYCSSQVDIFKDSLRAERITYGWADENAYNTNSSSISNIHAFYNSLTPAPNHVVIEDELKKFYPYDEFNLHAVGSLMPPNNSQPYRALSIDLRYDNNLLPSGNNLLRLLGYHAVFSNGSTQVTLSDAQLAAIPYAGFASDTLYGPQTIQRATWNADSLLAHGVNINSTATWTIALDAQYQIMANSAMLPSTNNFIVNLRCQFAAEGTALNNNAPPFWYCCDPWGVRLKVLIPRINTLSLSQFDSPITQVYGLPANPTHSACAYGHAFGIMHLGGLGNLPDFGFEYRPFTSWPMALNNAEATSVIAFNPNATPVNLVANTGVFQNPNSPLALLPSMPRKLVNWQGLLLRMHRQCNHAATVPFAANADSFWVNRYAYVHSAFHLPSGFNAQPVVPANIPVANPTWNANPPPIGFPSPPPSITTIPSGQATYSFTFTLPSMAQNLPLAVGVQLAGTQSNITLSNVTYSNNTIATTPIDSINWYFFPSNTNFTNGSVASLSLTLNDSCFTDTFGLRFFWRIACDSANPLFSTSPLNNACFGNGYYRTFQRGQGFNPSLRSRFDRQGCGLKGTLVVKNPTSQPGINLTQFSLALNTGLMLDSAEAFVGNQSQPLNGPSFALNSSGSTSYQWVQTTLTLDTLYLGPGDSLVYHLWFGLSDSLCSHYQQSTSVSWLMQASFLAKNVCGEIAINVPNIPIDTATLATALNFITQPNYACCRPIPYTLMQACTNGGNGAVVVHNPEADTVQVTISANGLSTLLNTTFSAATDTIPLPTGNYLITLFYPNTGAYFYQAFSIANQAISATLSILPNPVCPGNPALLVANATPANSTYTYAWLENNTSLSNTSDTLALYPTQTNTYTVVVSNGSCTDSVTQTLSVFSPPALTLQAAPTNIILGDAALLTATGNGTVVWTGIGLTQTTGDTVQAQPPALGEHAYTATLTDGNGCSVSDTITITVANPCSGIVIKADPQYLCGTTPAHLDYTISSGVDSTCTVSAEWVLLPNTTLEFADSSHTYLQASQNPTAATTDSCRLVLTVVCGGDTCLVYNTKIIYINPSLNDSLSNPTFKACGTQTYTSGVGTTLFLYSANLNGVAFYSVGPTYHYLYNSSSDTLHFSQDSLHPNQITLNWDDIGQPNTLDTLCFTISSDNHQCTKDTCVAIGRCCADTLTLNNVPAQACSLQTFSAPGWAHLKVVGLTLNGVAYTLNQNGTAWSIAGTSNTLPNTQATATANSVALNFAGFPQGEEGGTVCLQASDSTGQCTLDTCLVIAPCCPGTLMAGPNLQTWLNNLQSNPLYSPYVSYTSNTQTYEVTNLRFGINVPVAVNCNVTFTNCTILADGMGQFVVDPSHRFTLDSTQMRACRTPHRGISCTATAANLGFTNIRIVNHSRIQDAHCGVTVSQGASLVVNQATFDRNLCHITIKDLPEETYPATITGSVFDCSQNLLPWMWLDEPPQPLQTLNGIYIYNTAMVVFGDNNTSPGPLASNHNTIAHAANGISSINAGLSLFNTSISNCTTGVYCLNVHVQPWQYNDFDYLYNYIGMFDPANLPGANKNTFSNCRVGFKAVGKLHNYIRNNTFNDISNSGVLIDQNPHGYNDVYWNVFHNNQIAVNLRNLMGNRSRFVRKNIINSDSVMAKGVLIQNSFAPSNGTVTVRSNQVANAKVGIHLINSINCTVKEDSVSIPFKQANFPGMPNCVVLMESCARTNTSNNKIVAPTPQNGGICDYGCDGVRLAISDNNAVTCNEVYNKCDAFVFLASTTRNTVVKTNVMNNSFRGIYMGASKMGNQGQVGQPQDNQWIGSFDAHLYTDGFNNYRDTFYIRMPPTVGSSYHPYNFINGGFNLTTPIIINTLGVALPCPVIPPFNLGNMLSGTDQGLATEAASSYTFEGSALSIEKLGKEAVYKYIKDDPALALTPDQQSFKDSLAQEDLGKIEDIKRSLVYPLDSLTLASATTKTNSLAAFYEMEQLYREVLAISLSDNWLYKNLFTQAQATRLREIAAMCPYMQGRGVYAARVLLSYVDEEVVDYRSRCEEMESPGEGDAKRLRTNTTTSTKTPGPEQPIGIYPNPNKGSFWVKTNLKSPMLVEIFNQIGERLFVTQITGSRQTELSPGLSKGLYVCKVSEAGGAVYQTKLVIQ